MRVRDDEPAGLTPERLEFAVRLLDIAGYVAIEGAVSAETAADLRADLDAAATDPRWLENPFMRQLGETVVGPTLAYMSSSGSGLEAGSDGGGARFAHPDFPSLNADGTPMAPHLVAHLLLCDWTVDNGSTEVWPGSHHYKATADELRDGFVNAAAQELPSARWAFPAGTLVVRYPWLWHRSRENTTSESRDMLVCILDPADSPWRALAVEQGQQPVEIELDWDRPILK